MSTLVNRPLETNALGANPARKAASIRLPVIAVVLYVLLTLPYGFTKLSGDETHFVTIPYLMLGGDYALSAAREKDYGKAMKIAWQSYALAWRYYTRPAEADEQSAAILSQYQITHKAASNRTQPFVFTPDYFVTHRKSGKPLLSFILNIPAIALSYALPQSLLVYQRDYIYHPAFLVPRLSCWLMGLILLFLIYRFVEVRAGKEAGGWAAIIFALLPATALWSADLHQEVPMTLFLTIYSYFLFRKRYIWAAVFWGLAFGTKNQAIFGVLPILGEAIWVFFDPGTVWERTQRTLRPLMVAALVLTVGLIVSAPFGNPVGNMIEVFQTSAPTFGEEIQSGNMLLFWMPIWWGMGLLGVLAFRYLDIVRDSFDRYHILFLIVPAFFHFFNNTRVYTLLPSIAILIGTYFSRKTVTFTALALAVFGAYGVHSPYITVRGVGYRGIVKNYPPTIEEIESKRGVGSIHEIK